MRVLLDEQIDVALRHRFAQHLEVETVDYRGWKNLENGDLLRQAAAEYEGFVTNDGSIPHQQNISRLDLRVVVLEAPSNKIEDLAPLVPDVQQALSKMRPGEMRRVGRP